MPTLEFTTVLESLTCGKCGITFAAPEKFFADARKNGETFYCPNGHPRWFGESEADKLRRQLTQAQQKLDQEQAETANQRKLREKAERSVIAQKANNTKLKKKLATGTCPCCDKLFPDLAAHMANDHPDFEGREEPTETPKPE